MATFNATQTDSAAASAALLRGTLVKPGGGAGQVGNTAVDTVRDEIGVLMEAASAQGQIVRYQTLRGSSRVIALTDNSAISIDTPLYKGANGKVSATSTGSVLVGYALEANGSVDATLITVRPV